MTHLQQFICECVDEAQGIMKARSIGALDAATELQSKYRLSDSQVDMIAWRALNEG